MEWAILAIVVMNAALLWWQLFWVTPSIAEFRARHEILAEHLLSYPLSPAPAPIPPPPPPITAKAKPVESTKIKLVSNSGREIGWKTVFGRRHPTITTSQGTFAAYKLDYDGTWVYRRVNVEPKAK